MNVKISIGLLFREIVVCGKIINNSNYIFNNISDFKFLFHNWGKVVNWFC